MSTVTEATFEAFCSWLYMNANTEFLGEQDVEGQHCAYFHMGEKPKDMRITVMRGALEEVNVRVEWRNYHADPRNPLKGEQRFTVRTYAAQQADLEDAVAKTVQSILECYLDVLEGEGIAGPIEKLAPEVEETDDDE